MNIQYLADVISSPVHNIEGVYKRNIIFVPSRILRTTAWFQFPGRGVNETYTLLRCYSALFGR